MKLMERKMSDKGNKKMVGSMMPAELVDEFEAKISPALYTKAEVLRILIRRFSNGEIDITNEDVLQERRKDY